MGAADFLDAGILKLSSKGRSNLSLLHKPIQQITLDDLKSLVGDIPVREDQTIDYKREMIRAEQLCEAVTSFANTQGGE